MHNALTSWPVPLCTRHVACRTPFLSRQRDVIASFSFGACTVQTNFIWRDIFIVYNVIKTLFSLCVTLYYFIDLLDSILSSPGQKHGGCGHLMASFDTHSFCARCREKSKGPDPCVSKSDCQACNILTEDQRLHPKLSTSSADDRIDKLDKKWADRFNRLEALLLAKSIDQPEPTFQAPKVAPTHPPTSGCCQVFCPLPQTFYRPTDQVRFVWYRPFNSTRTGYQQIASNQQT